MANFKVKRKDSHLKIKRRLRRKEELDGQQLQVFNTKLIRGLMRPTPDGKRKLIYSAPDGIPLMKYLQRGIAVNDFFVIAAQIVEVTDKVVKNNLDIGNLVLDPEQVFINELTREVHFIYEPLTRRDDPTENIFTFFYTLITGANFGINENLRPVNDFFAFLQTRPAYYVKEIEDKIGELCPDVYRQVRRQKTGQSKNLSNRQFHFDQDPIGVEGGTVLLDDDEGTALLDDDGQAMQSFSAQYAPRRPEAYLKRRNDGGKIAVNKDVFRLGKDPAMVDFAIEDNTAISRAHANIIRRDHEFYVSDNHSTNRTFLNGMALAPNQETRIYDGDTIMLADEAFEFHTV